VLHLIYQQIWKTQQWSQVWKRSVFIPIPEKDNAKECSNYHTIALISHTSKVIPKILQARLQQYVSGELQAGFRKGRGTRDQIANIRWTTEKAREFHKNIYFCFIDCTKAFDCGSQQTVENSSRDGDTILWGTEDEMVGWHHRLDGHKSEQAPGIGDGQGSLACTVHGVAKSRIRLSD